MKKKLTHYLWNTQNCKHDWSLTLSGLGSLHFSAEGLMVKMESLQNCDQQTVKNTRQKKKGWCPKVSIKLIKVVSNKKRATPDSQLLFNESCLQDVDEVFQVIEVFGPGQPAAHCTHHLHRCRNDVLMLQHTRTENRWRNYVSVIVLCFYPK